MINFKTATNTELKEVIFDIDSAMERWHLGRDEDYDTLMEINDILVEIGFLSFFNTKNKQDDTKTSDESDI